MDSRNRGEFRARNTLQAPETPNYRNQVHSRQRVRDSVEHQNSFEELLRSSTTTTPPGDLPRFQRQSSRSFSPTTELPTFCNSRLFTPSSLDGESCQQSPNSVGNSSSLFDYKSPASFNFGSTPAESPEAAIPVAFGAAGRTKKSRNNTDSATMVTERSPAKAPLYPTIQNVQLPSQLGNPSPTPPSQPGPIFGQATLPLSPLHKKKLENTVFLQPKPPRPQYQNEQPKPAHPHLQAAKDAAKGFVRSFVHGGPPQSNPGVCDGNAVPITRPSEGSFTTTKPTQQQTFSSLGGYNQGFGATSQGTHPTNYVDLTSDAYRDRISRPEPYTFVDPAKAAADLKALLEGAIEEDDDMPRTRSPRKRDVAKTESLVAKLQDLAVGNEGATSEDEEEDEDDGTVEGMKVKLLPHQIEGLEWMKERELGTRKKGTVPKGGILADDMGLGKTLQSIALILQNQKPSGSDVEDSRRKLPLAMEKCTLVVAPLALIRQWELEIKDKVDASHALRVCVHHGPQRTKRFQDLKKYDVVITTYQILVSEYGNSSPDADGLQAGCFGLHWYRIILDEAHTIKNRNAKATQACYALRSEYRWCLTGTPMQNNLDELQSLIKFLRIKPYDNLKEWKDQIDRPMKNGRGDVAMERLRHFLKIFMKRRTKEILKKEGALNPGGKAGQSSSTGFKVTERKIEKVFAEFSPEERRFYQRLEKRTDKSLEEMMGGEKVNYASALVLLLRLRQACNHPKLVAGKLAKDGEALGIEGGSGTQTPRKANISTADVDDIADLFGGLKVGTKKCEACGSVLTKDLASAGAILCRECEEDQAVLEKRHKSRKSKKHTKDSTVAGRKQRNRNVVLDSDDEEDGDWTVPEDQRWSANLGKAGGTGDENAEGEGESIGSEDSDTDASDTDASDVKPSTKRKEKKKEFIVIDSDESDSDVESDVEDEFSSSEEEAKLSTIMTSTKIKHLLKILGKEAAQHKFIVFSQFTSMLDLIEPFLKRDGYKYTRYDGSMRNDQREASLSRLRNDKSCRVLLCSLKCGSLGLNLTAATRVVILEPFWNPFVEEQAIDRVHRLTQTIDVVVYKITIQDSVEERILALQEKKRELANQAIEGGAKENIGKLGMKEILQLFRREAEHSVPNRSAESYTFGATPSVLNRQTGFSTDSGPSSREGSVIYQGERRIAQPVKKAPRAEHPVYGRR